MAGSGKALAPVLSYRHPFRILDPTMVMAGSKPIHFVTFLDRTAQQVRRGGYLAFASGQRLLRKCLQSGRSFLSENARQIACLLSCGAIGLGIIIPTAAEELTPPPHRAIESNQAIQQFPIDTTAIPNQIPYDACGPSTPSSLPFPRTLVQPGPVSIPRAAPIETSPPPVSGLRSTRQASVTPTDDPLPNLTVSGTVGYLNTAGTAEFSYTNNGYWESGRVSDPWIETTVRNTGTASSTSYAVDLYRSNGNDFTDSAARTHIARVTILVRDPMTSIAPTIPKTLQCDDLILKCRNEIGEGIPPNGSTRIIFDRIDLPQDTGTYYYAARVVHSATESDVTDNWNPPSDNVRIEVWEPADLAIDKLAVIGSDPIDATSSINLQLQATIVNRGGNDSQPLPHLDQFLFRKDPNAPGEPENEFMRQTISFATIPALAPNASHTVVLTLSTPAELGLYEYRYIIRTDPLVAGGSNSVVDDDCENNMRSVTVNLNAPPDLTVQHVSITDSDQSVRHVNVESGGTITFTATVANLSVANSVTPAETWIETHTGARDSTPNTVVAKDPLTSPIAGGETQTLTFDVTTRLELGTYWLRFCAGSSLNQTETIIANNCTNDNFIISVVDRTGPLPEFIIDKILVDEADPTIMKVSPGSSFDISFNVKNIAKSTAPSPNDLSIAAHQSNSAGPRLTEPGRHRVVPSGSLFGGESKRFNIAATAPTVEGNFSLAVCIAVDIVTNPSSSGETCAKAKTNIDVRMAKGTITLQANPNHLFEGAGQHSIQFTAKIPTAVEPPSASFDILIFADGGTATPDLDYTGLVLNLNALTTLRIPADSRTGSVSIPVLVTDDNVAEVSETILIVADAAEYFVQFIHLTINDDDPPPSRITIDLAPSSVLEDAGTQAVQLTATFSPDRVSLLESVPISISVSGQSNDPIATFSPSLPFSIEIASETTSVTQTFDLMLADNSTINDNEIVEFVGIADGYTVMSSTLTIYNDEIPPPENLSATAAIRQIILNWALPAMNQSPPITGYQVEVSTDDGITWSLARLVMGQNTSSYTHPNLPNQYSARYRVRTVTESGNSEPSMSILAASIPVVAPTAPMNLRAVGSRNRVALTWDPPHADGGDRITRYEIQRMPLGGGWSLATSIHDTSQTSYVDRELNAGLGLHYRVFAINSAGRSPPSTTVLAFTDHAYSANLLADVNRDAIVDYKDALIIYYAYAFQTLLGNGTNDTGFSHHRHTFLQPLIADLVSPIDQDLMELLHNAIAIRDVANYPSMDINESGAIDQDDALIMYYAFNHINLLAPRWGHYPLPGIRAATLGHYVHPMTPQPTDDSIDELLRRANQLVRMTNDG